MRYFHQLLIVAALGIAPRVVADSFSTDATMAYQKDEGIINVVVNVSRLLETDDEVMEELIASPRIQTSPGVKATAKVGLQPGHPEYEQKENVNVDVSWPYPNESGAAMCAVTIRRGDKIVSKSRLQVKIEGQGRSPLVISADDINPRSVRLGDVGFETFVMLEFIHKTKEEVKKLAIENYGNKVQFRESDGRLVEVGQSFGAYNQIGMALDCGSAGRAKTAAILLRGDKAQ